MILKLIGYRVFDVIHAVLNVPRYIRDYFQFSRCKHLQDDMRFTLSLMNLYPCLKDRTSNTPFDAHYTYHPAWAARILAKTKPDIHVDISSSLAFVTLVSAYQKIKFYDYRPAEIHLSNLECGAVDICNLPFESNSISSISSMHVIEHIGLGRYGDTIDSKGDVKAIQELIRVTKEGGNILFVVPIGGEPVIQYNGHRIYSYDMVLSLFSQCEIMDFSLIDDSGDFISSADENLADGCKHGCGCFWFRKRCNE